MDNILSEPARQASPIPTSELDAEIKKWRAVDRTLRKHADRVLRRTGLGGGKERELNLNAARLLTTLISAVIERRTAFPAFPDVDHIAALSGFPRQKFYPAATWLEEAKIAKRQKTADGWIRFSVDLDPEKNWSVIFSRTDEQDRILNRGIRDATFAVQEEIVSLPQEENRRFDDARFEQAKAEVLARIEQHDATEVSRVVTNSGMASGLAEREVSRVVTPPQSIEHEPQSRLSRVVTDPQPFKGNSSLASKHIASKLDAPRKKTEWNAEKVRMLVAPRLTHAQNCLDGCRPDFTKHIEFLNWMVAIGGWKPDKSWDIELGYKWQGEFGAQWCFHWRRDPEKFWRCFEDAFNKQKAGEIKVSIGACAAENWERFAGKGELIPS